MRGKLLKGALAAMLGSMFAIAGCGGDDSVSVSLFEWGVDAPESIDGGTVTIEASNDGAEIHELVIVRADSTDGFVLDDTGKVDEDGFAEGDFIGEIEEFDAETTESGTFDLDAGTYILFCNIVEEEEDGSHESHFDEGMFTTLVVN